MVDAHNGAQPGERRYLVSIHDREVVVAISDGPDGPVLHVDDEPVPLQVAPVPAPAIAVRIDGQMVRGLARVRDAEVDVVLGGEMLVARVDDQRRQLLRRAAGGGRARVQGEVIRAPMPGLVVGVPVAVGDTVIKGASVVVLQAMKMENELRSSTSGRVVEIRVEKGQAVEQGQVLVVVE